MKFWIGKKINLIATLNRRKLQELPHIKEYNKLRYLHGDIVDSMIDYIKAGKYDFQKELKKASENFKLKQIKCLQSLELDLNNDDDMSIFMELFVYPNIPSLKSVTDIYLEKHRYCDKEKVALLEAMKNSYVSLFKVVDADREKGYVYYEDVFTKEKFRVVDIAMSSTFSAKSKEKLYLYNRIITIDKDMAFCAGIHCPMTSNNKKLMKYIENHQKRPANSIMTCMELYRISKCSDNGIEITYNNSY